MILIIERCGASVNATLVQGLPFSRDQFFDVFAAYNTAIWPAQIIAHGLAAMALGALWLPPKQARVTALCTLALMWGWTGAVYHILFFARINGGAIWFGSFFLAQASLFFIHAARPHSSDQSRTAWRRAWAWLLIVYALAIYPIIGMLSGHFYPGAPVFGVTPCPLVIFSFGLLLLVQEKTPWLLFVIPTLWSVIGGTSAFLLGVYQDWALPISAGVAILANISSPRSSPGGLSR